jgi:Tol biopolymer transport system component
LLLTALAAGVICRQAPADEPAKELAQEVARKGWIAYAARSQKGDWDLFLCRPDGSEVRSITKTPEFNEAYPQFSRDGKKLLYRRLGRQETINGNRYGEQGSAVISDSDGANPVVLGEPGEFPWACWSPDGRQIACLKTKGIEFVDVATRQVVRRLDRKGFFQQITWSPDGKWLSGVANSLGTSWAIARMNVQSGEINAASKVDCCTPDWFPDSAQVIFSNRPVGQKSNGGYGWTQLWMADVEGKSRQLVYGEDGRHVYGGHVSPDGKYVLFTGNQEEDGDTGHSGSPMGLMRLADAPSIGGTSAELRKLHPKTKDGPVLKLPVGWEPCWTFSQAPGGAAKDSGDGNAATRPATQPEAVQTLAREVRDKGWIIYSSREGQDNWDLYLARPDGTDRRKFTDTAGFNEGAARFSPDGRKVLYYRLPKDTPLDNNTYGTFDLVIANADGSKADVWGRDYPWASWGPDSDQLACLRTAGIVTIDLKTRKALSTVKRGGIVEQLLWSPDGKWFCGTANGLGPYWVVGRLNAATGEINAVSETDRYNCTPDWFPDSRHLVYSRGIIPKEGGWAELWMSTGDGKERSLIYAEADRHAYGGALSPDGKYVLFTRSQTDLGQVDNSRTKMALMRLADRPIVAGAGEALRKAYPKAKQGPVLDLPWGWEPHWTYADVVGGEK